MRFRPLRSLRQVSASGKRVLIRLDLDVPVRAGKVLEAARLRSALPTLKWLRSHGAITIIMGHHGRPHGVRSSALSLRPMANALSKMMRTNIHFVDDWQRASGKKQLAAGQAGSLFCLENLRFDRGEETKDPLFTRRLAECADLFVNDSFGTAHNDHASTVGIATFLPSAAGFRFEKEVEALSQLIDKPKRPFVAIIGGAKISSKASVIHSMLKRADIVLIGGALANTFFLALHHSVGVSLVEASLVPEVRSLIDHRLRYPIDVVTSTSLKGGRRETKAVGAVGARDFILDIGPDTIRLYDREIQRAKTVVWGGPMGMFENPKFASGTIAIAKACARSRGFKVAGGGETIQAIHRAHVTKQFSFLSMGGGAMLKFLEGKPLPAISSLQQP